MDNVIEFHSELTEKKDKAKKSAIEIINDCHNFVMVYREAASCNWRWIYAGISAEDLMAVGVIIQNRGVQEYDTDE